MSVDFLRDLAQAHKGWEEEKGLLAAADEIERLRHALNVTDGQSRECLGDDDGVPCVSHLAYMDCEQEIKRLREDYDGYRKRSQEENDALRSGLLKAEQRIEEFEHMLRGQTFTVKCEGRHITDAQIDAAWRNRQIIFSPDNPDGPVMLIAEDLGIERDGDGWKIGGGDA